MVLLKNRSLGKSQALVLLGESPDDRSGAPALACVDWRAPCLVKDEGVARAPLALSPAVLHSGRSLHGWRDSETCPPKWPCDWVAGSPLPTCRFVWVRGCQLRIATRTEVSARLEGSTCLPWAFAPVGPSP